MAARIIPTARNLNDANLLVQSIAIGKSRYIDGGSAISALAALAHPTRLDAFRLPIRH